MVESSSGESKQTFYFKLSVFACVFAGSFQYGYNISSANGPATFIKDTFYPVPANLTEVVWTKANDTWTVTDCADVASCASCNEADCKLDYASAAIAAEAKKFSEDRENKYAFQVGIFAVGGITGSFLVKTLITKFGRKGSQAINMFVSLAAAANFLGAYYYKSDVCFTVARILIGLFSGFATGVCPMYIMEISSRNDRGKIGVLNQLLITIGILVAQIIALPALMGKAELWGWFLALTAAPAIFWLLTYTMTAESPRYTIIEKSDEASGRKVLEKLRGTSNVEEEIDEMREEAIKAQAEEEMSLGQVLSEKSIRWQLISICLMMLCQQLSGINAVFFYTNKIFAAAGYTEATQLKLSVLIGAENVAMTFVSMALMEKMGRKSLMVWGYGIMVVFCFAMVGVLNCLDKATWVPHLSVFCVMGYIVGFAIGPGPVPWIWNTEFFQQSARAGGATISCVICWVCTYLVGQFFPAIQLKIGAYVFVFFGAICLFAFFYIKAKLPETRGRTFESIFNHFAKMNGVPEQNSETKIPLTSRDDE